MSPEGAIRRNWFALVESAHCWERRACLCGRSVEELDELACLFRRDHGLAVLSLAHGTTHTDDVWLQIDKQMRLLDLERTSQCDPQPSLLTLVNKLSNLFQ